MLLQGEMCAGAIVICHVRQQQVAEVAFAEHDNVVEAFSSDRTDQPFGIPVLPWRPWRRRLSPLKGFADLLTSSRNSNGFVTSAKAEMLAAKGGSQGWCQRPGKR